MINQLHFKKGLPETSSLPRSACRTSLASPILPLLTNHRGDSGKKNTASRKYAMEGKESTPSINLQLAVDFNDIKNTIVYAKHIPILPVNCGKVFNSPLMSEGAVSDI